MSRDKLCLKLIDAACEGDCSRIRQLLDNNSNSVSAMNHRPSPLGATPLILATAFGHVKAGMPPICVMSQCRVVGQHALHGIFVSFAISLVPVRVMVSAYNKPRLAFLTLCCSTAHDAGCS